MDVKEQRKPQPGFSDGLDRAQFTPKASSRSHKRPRRRLGAPKASIKSKNDSPSLSSNGTSTLTSTTARSSLFDTSSRKSAASKESVGDYSSAFEAKSPGKSPNEKQSNANDPKSPPLSKGKRSSLFGAVMENIHCTPAKKSSSAVNFLDNFSPYAKTPSTPFSPASVDRDQWQEASLADGWFDFSLYTKIEFEGHPRLDLTYDDATALLDETSLEPTLSAAQVYHSFPQSMFTTANGKVPKVTWRSAFRSLYFKWKAQAGESCFYMVSGAQTTVFRKRIEDDEIIPEVTFSKCRFSDTLRQRYGVQLYLAAKWNKHVKGTEWEDSLQQARKGIAVSPATKAELQALHNAPTIGADISVLPDHPKTGSSTVPPLLVSGQDDCDAVYEYFMNAVPVEAQLITRDGAFLHSCLERLSAGRRQSLEGPILPSAMQTLCRVAANIANNSSKGESYWLVTATNLESTLMVAWEKERPGIVAYKKG